MDETPESERTKFEMERGMSGDSFYIYIRGHDTFRADVKSSELEKLQDTGTAISTKLLLLHQIMRRVENEE
jgi:hypothetical protein